MKKLLLILCMLTGVAYSQVYQAMPQAGYGPVKRFWIDSVLIIPTNLTSASNLAGGREVGKIRYNIVDSSIQVWTGSQWRSAGGGGTLTSLGSGFRVAVNGTNNVKSLTGGTGIVLDSATAGQVNIEVDPATIQVPLSGVTAATSSVFSVNHGVNTIGWQWIPNDGYGLAITTLSTSAGVAAEIKALQVGSSGVNANNAVINSGIYSEVTNSGTGSTNIAGDFLVNSGDINIAARFRSNAGGIGIQVPRGSVDLGSSGGSGETGRINWKGVTSGNIIMESMPASGSYYWIHPTTGGTAGHLLTSAGGGAGAPMTWTDPASLSGSAAISSLTAATGNNDINNAALQQIWRWNTISGTYGLLLTSNSTAAAANDQVLLGGFLSGANATASQTTKTAVFSNTHTGTTSTNIAGYFDASGGTNNYAIIVPSDGGSVGIGTSTPTDKLHVAGVSAGAGVLVTGTTSPSLILKGGGSPAVYFQDAGGTSAYIAMNASYDVSLALPGWGAPAIQTLQATNRVGIANATPTSTLHVNGSFATAYTAQTTTYPITTNDYTIECTSGTFTTTLPTAVGCTGRIYFITNSGAGTITLATTSSQTFVNVVATPTTLTLATLTGVTVQSNGANWLKINGF